MTGVTGSISSLLVAIIGAIVFLMVYHAIRGTSRSRVSP
jgi:uncharacterized membrane protein YeaQ/YmgE (transglycosylase-associated protein family)